jgi:hypothetical protein
VRDCQRDRRIRQPDDIGRETVVLPPFEWFALENSLKAIDGCIDVRDPDDNLGETDEFGASDAVCYCYPVFAGCAVTNEKRQRRASTEISRSAIRSVSVSMSLTGSAHAQGPASP